MRKYYLWFIFCCLGIPSLFAGTNIKTVDDLILLHRTPQSVCNWVENNIWYTAEAPGQDHWQSPEETLERCKGDCDDFGILVMTALDKLGYQTYFLCLRGYRGNHVIVVIRDKGKYYISSNGSFEGVPFATTLEEVFPNSRYTKNYYSVMYFTKEYVSDRISGKY